MDQLTTRGSNRTEANESLAAPDTQDFVWRFKLDEKPPAALLDHPLDELLRVQWEELLKLCVPHYQGKPVKIDGFATMRDPDKLHLVYDDTARPDPGTAEDRG